jgi:hypothetical protein
MVVNSGVLEIIAKRHGRADESRKRRRTIRSPRVGVLVSVSDAKELLVDFRGNRTGAPVIARRTTTITAVSPGMNVLLMFEDADPGKPIIVGVMDDHILPDSVEITASKDLTLSCGEASITLTRAGKVLIRGAYVLSRSSGVNRIKGGSVQIN